MNIAYNMDCLDGMKTLDDCCIDLTVTSPPYDNLRDYEEYFKMQEERFARHTAQISLFVDGAKQEDGAITLW